jgi:hypothetical protein
MTYSHEEHVEAGKEALREGDIDDVRRLVAANYVEVPELQLEENDPLIDELEMINKDQEQEERWLKAKKLAESGPLHLSEEDARLVYEVAIESNDRQCAEVALRNIKALHLQSELAKRTVQNALHLVIQAN